MPEPIEPWKRHLPNALTCLRLVFAAALFVVLARWPGFRDLPGHATEYPTPVWPLAIAAILFTLAAITDALDGMLARRWQVVSAFGRVMDPFADKVLILGTLVMLIGPNFQLIGINHLAGFTPWMVVVILARELLVTSIRAVLEGQGVQFPAGWSGKIKMILQSLVIPAILLAIALDPVGAGGAGGAGNLGPRLRPFIVIAAWVTTILTAASAWPYLGRAAGALKHKP